MLLILKKFIFLALFQLIMPMIPDVIAHPPPPAEFTLRIESENCGQMSINLKRVNSMLANKNLPVMITSAKGSSKYVETDENVMEKIGEFVMYHDYESKSAFIYFRKTGLFNGIVDIRFYVKGLHINDIHKVQKVKTSSRKYLKWLLTKRAIKISRKLRSTDNRNTTKIRTRRDDDTQDLPIIYPELLVAISYDMHKALGKNYVKTMSHVLTVYNGVDMLYKLVKSATIHLNIATVVIETSEGDWDFLPSSPNGKEILIDSDTIILAISVYFKNHERFFPRDSYDYIAYNTRRKIWNRPGNMLAHGVSLGLRPAFVFPFDKENRYYRLNMAITDHKGYESYSTIAHELAHIFSAEHDGENPRLQDHACSRRPSLMAKSANCDILSLHWSKQTEMEFIQFFSSPASCNLRNFPQSLLPSPRKPRTKLTGTEQCKCYGYESFKKPVIYISDWCENSLQCLDANNELQKNLPLPFDGTPCSINRVCWDKTCVYLDLDATT